MRNTSSDSLNFIPLGPHPVISGGVDAHQEGGTVKHTCKTNSKNVVAEMLTAMDLPRINFVRKVIQEAGGGLDRTAFVVTMGT